MPNQTLSLIQSQRLQMVLAPQLRQSLEMLQAPVLELRAMIQHEVEQNPTIEEIPPETVQVEIEPDVKGEEDHKELDFDKEFEVLARLDDEWRDYFYQNFQNQTYDKQAYEKRQFFLDSLPQKESLQEHLLQQLRLSGLSDSDIQIGELIIGSINDDGYLETSVEDIAESAGFDVIHLEDILSIIQEFHPTGVCSRDLKECLLLQIERLGKNETLAGDIVRSFLDKLGSRKIHDIAKTLKVSIEEVQHAVNFISTLDPKPGRIYRDDEATYITPEVIVQKIEGEYVIFLDDSQLPHLKISNHYRSIMKDDDTKLDVKNYIKDRIRSGDFLIKSIHQRQKTIYKIASEIVSRQVDFLDNGISHLKPLTMSELAETVGVHETTVSRAVSGKYMRTPIGVFEMKYFFTYGIKAVDGKEISNKTVKNIIANLVANEDKVKPVSDQEIKKQLSEKGINIARRTIAKYRLILHIPPSHMRKVY